MLEHYRRSGYCGTYRLSDAGRELTVCGWVQRNRRLGALIFTDLRDRSGILQLSFGEGTDKTVFALAETLHPEYVVVAKGILRERESKNLELPTGEVELFVTALRILAKAETPPFEILDEVQANDALRLSYRYLDLRRPTMQAALKTRHRIAKIARDYFDEQGFYEIETPMLTKSTPEGARDYLVPSRVHPGKFYALPQSPQQYKQLLMLAGFDRYMQITRCFRDEDLRADRQPEFTQIDLELSFCDEDEIMGIQEGFLRRVFWEVLGVEVETPFPRLSWQEAMNRYGSDKPDLRFGFELCDISDLVQDCGFTVFSAPVAAGGSVRLINLKGQAAAFPRKKLDNLTEFVKTYGAKGLAWARLLEEGASSSYQKFLSEGENAAILARAGATQGDLILIVGDEKTRTVQTALGELRRECARQLGLLDPNKFRFVWITEFPMFEYDEEAGRYNAVHHPFTAPMAEDMEKLQSDPGACRARAYDVALNGVELGGGSIRVNTPEMQAAVFRALGFRDEQAEAQFGHLINAFRYGAPPHGGLAYGLDRLCMLMAGADSIRDVIAFPKVQNASELMTSCPGEVSEAQLHELSLKLADKSAPE